MLVTRRSQLSWEENTREINCTPEQLDAYERGAGLLRELFPDLTDDEREFIATGITKEEWEQPSEGSSVIPTAISDELPF